MKLSLLFVCWAFGFQAFGSAWPTWGEPCVGENLTPNLALKYIQRNEKPGYPNFARQPFSIFSQMRDCDKKGSGEWKCSEWYPYRSSPDIYHLTYKIEGSGSNVYMSSFGGAVDPRPSWNIPSNTHIACSLDERPVLVTGQNNYKWVANCTGDLWAWSGAHGTTIEFDGSLHYGCVEFRTRPVVAAQTDGYTKYEQRFLLRGFGGN